MKQCKTKWYLYNSVKKTDETRKIYFPLTSSAAPKIYTLSKYIYLNYACVFLFSIKVKEAGWKTLEFITNPIFLSLRKDNAIARLEVLGN